MDKFEYVTIQLVPLLLQINAKLGDVPPQSPLFPKKQQLEKLIFSFLFDTRVQVREKCIQTIQQLMEKNQLFLTEDEMVSVYLIEQYQTSSKTRNAEIAMSVIKGIGCLSEKLGEKNIVVVLQKTLDILLKGNSNNLPANICAEIYRTLKNIFDNNKNIAAPSIAKVIDFLTEKVCPTLKSDDPKKVIAYIVMMTHAHKCLHRLDKELSASRVHKFFKLIFESLILAKNESEETSSAAFTNLQNLIWNCFDAELFRERNKNSSMDDDEESPMLAIANTLQTGLDNTHYAKYDLISQLTLDTILKIGLVRSRGIKVSSINNCVLDFLLFTSDVLQDLLKRESDKKKEGASALEQTTLKNARSVYYLEKIVGYCIRVLGPAEAFKEGGITFDGWVLSILINHKVDYSNVPNMKIGQNDEQDLSKLTGICVNGQLAYWVNVLLPMAKSFYDKSKTTEVDRHGNNSFLTLYEKIWALLPQFCSYPIDLESQFSTIAPLLGEMINSSAKEGVDYQIKIACCNSLALTINTYHNIATTGKIPDNIFGLNKNICEKGLRAVANFNKQFIPILFNLYVEQNSKATTADLQNAVGKAITAFFSVCDHATVTDYFKLVLKKILEINSESDEEKFFGFFDLSITMLNSVPNSCLEIYYKFLIPYLKITTSTTPKLQKKAYKGLYILLSSWKRDSGVAMKRETIDEILTIFQSIAEITMSKKFRVKCFNLLVTKYHDLIFNNPLSTIIIGECIFNIDNTENQKSRDLSISTLKAFIDPLIDNKYTQEQKQSNVIDFVVRRVLPGLCGKSNSMIASTINALSELLPSYSKYLQPILKDVFDSVTIVLQDENVKVVSSLMQFFKRCVTLFDKETLKPYVSLYLNTFFNHSNEKSGGTSLRVQLRFLVTKLFKKFSFDELKDTVTEKERHHFLKNTFKSMHRVKKTKKDGEKEEEMSDEEPEKKQDSEFAVNKGKLVINDLPEDEDKDSEESKKFTEKQRTVDLIKQSIARGAPVSKKKEQELNADQLFLAKLEKRKHKRETKIVFGGAKVKGQGAVDPYAYIPLDPRRLNKRERNKESNFQKFERITKKKK